jgi:hypothetical protein
LFGYQVLSLIIFSPALNSLTASAFALFALSKKNFALFLCKLTAPIYVIKFVSDLWQVGGFLRFSPPITDRHDLTEILLKVGLNAITLTPQFRFVLDQHAELDFYNASSLKQQSAGRHVAPLGHIILIPNQPVVLFLLNDACEKVLHELALNNNHSLTHSLTHSLNHSI